MLLSMNKIERTFLSGFDEVRYMYIYVLALSND